MHNTIGTPPCTFRQQWHNVRRRELYSPLALGNPSINEASVAIVFGQEGVIILATQVDSRSLKTGDRCTSDSKFFASNDGHSSKDPC